MDRFGILVLAAGPETIGLVQELKRALASWNVLQEAGLPELTLRVVGGPPSLGYAAANRWALRQAAHLLARTTGLGFAPGVSNFDLGVVEIRVSGDSAESKELARKIAWALFLWTAGRHPVNPQMEQYYKEKAPEETVQPLVPPEPPVRPIHQLVRTATASQPFRLPNGVTGRKPGMAPITESPPVRRGG